MYKSHKCIVFHRSFHVYSVLRAGFKWMEIYVRGLGLKQGRWVYRHISALHSGHFCETATGVEILFYLFSSSLPFTLDIIIMSFLYLDIKFNLFKWNGVKLITFFLVLFMLSINYSEWIEKFNISSAYSFCIKIK